MNVLANRLVGPETEENKRLSIIEIKVDELLASQDSAQRSIQQIVQETESHLKSGRDTLIMTSRNLVKGDDELSSLAIGSSVAEALVRVSQGIEVRPRYIIAKVHPSSISSVLKITHRASMANRAQGGITSSDAATKGLNIKRALIVGQAAPGVPLWRCDEQTSRHPGVPFVVFPGNVGGEKTLCELVETWR